MGSLTMEQIRRRILVNATPPHLETASGTVANFSTNVSMSFASCTIEFAPQQAGSGDPSPTNIRPISGWNGITCYISNTYPDETPTTIAPVDWTTEAGTVYGGYVDLVSGELVATHIKLTFDRADGWSINKYTNYNRFIFARGQFERAPKNDSAAYFSYLKNDFLSVHWNGFIGSTGNLLVYVPTTIETASDWGDYLSSNPLEMCYELETPITYNLTPQQLNSLRGTNNVWSDTGGNVTVQYWTY